MHYINLKSTYLTYFLNLCLLFTFGISFGALAAEEESAKTSQPFPIPFFEGKYAISYIATELKSTHHFVLPAGSDFHFYPQIKGEKSVCHTPTKQGKLVVSNDIIQFIPTPYFVGDIHFDVVVEGLGEVQTSSVSLTYLELSSLPQTPVNDEIQLQSGETNQIASVKDRLGQVVPNANQDAIYYGRGYSFGLDANQKIYVCTNQHTRRRGSACYFTTDYGVSWHAVPIRTGTILGHGVGTKLKSTHHFVFSADSNFHFSQQIKGEKSVYYTSTKQGKLVVTDDIIWGQTGDGIQLQPGETASFPLKNKWKYGDDAN